MADSDIKLLADEHIPKDVIGRLRIWEVDIKAVKEIDMRGASDEEILEIAKEGDRVILTADQKDFPRLAKNTDHPGMIVITKRMSTKEILKETMKVLDTIDSEDIVNTVQYIPW